MSHWLYARPSEDTMNQQAENKETSSIDPALQFYRIPKVAKLLDIKRVTLYSKVNRGELPPFQSVGGIKGYTGAQILMIYSQPPSQKISS